MYMSFNEGGIGMAIHEMKGDRDGKSAKTSATKYSGAVVVNDHIFPRPSLYHFSC